MNSSDGFTSLGFWIYNFFNEYLLGFLFQLANWENKPVLTNKKFVFFCNCSNWEKFVEKLGKQNWLVWCHEQEFFREIVTVSSKNSHFNIFQVVSRRASFMASAGITALLKKMDYKDVVIAIDGSLFRYLILIFCLAVFYFGNFFLVYLRILYTVWTRELV